MNKKELSKLREKFFGPEKAEIKTKKDREVATILALQQQGFTVVVEHPDATEFNRKYRVYQDKRCTKLVILDKNGNVSCLEG
jgi:hypothetical protein